MECVCGWMVGGEWTGECQLVARPPPFFVMGCEHQRRKHDVGDYNHDWEDDYNGDDNNNESDKGDNGDNSSKLW